jgi:hypothetical protein
MKDFVNTVPAKDQMIASSVLSFLGKADSPTKILVLGNSITRHGPKEDIGWPYDWGMAASTPENDYVHRLYAKLTKSGRNVLMRIHQSAGWERTFLEPNCLDAYTDDKAFEADVIIFRLGENVLPENAPSLKDATVKLINFLKKDGTRLIFTTCFWEHPEKDTAIKEAAKHFGAPIADILCTDDSMMAIGKFEHEGVAGHPGDKGMEMIASKIFELI